MLRLGGLPFDATVVRAALPTRAAPNLGCLTIPLWLLLSASLQKDVERFMSEFKVAGKDIALCYKRNGDPLGKAYAKLASRDQAKAAISKLNKEKVGSRWVELTMASLGEFEQAQAQSAKVCTASPLLAVDNSVTDNVLFICTRCRHVLRAPPHPLLHRAPLPHRRPILSSRASCT